MDKWLIQFGTTTEGVRRMITRRGRPPTPQACMTLAALPDDIYTVSDFGRMGGCQARNWLEDRTGKERSDGRWPELLNTNYRKNGSRAWPVGVIRESAPKCHGLGMLYLACLDGDDETRSAAIAMLAEKNLEPPIEGDRLFPATLAPVPKPTARIFPFVPRPQGRVINLPSFQLLSGSQVRTAIRSTSVAALFVMALVTTALTVGAARGGIGHVFDIARVDGWAAARYAAKSSFAPGLAARSHLEMGFTLYKNQEKVKALAVIEQGLALEGIKDIDRGKGHYYSGAVHAKSERYMDAITNYEKAEAIYLEKGQWFLLFQAQTEKARVQIFQGQLEQAEELLVSTYPYFEKSRDPTKTPLYWLSTKHDLYRLQGKRSEMVNLASQGLNEAKSVEAVAEWHAALGEAHALNGNIGLAREHTDFADREFHRLSNDFLWACNRVNYILLDRLEGRDSSGRVQTLGIMATEYGWPRLKKLLDWVMEVDLPSPST